MDDKVKERFFAKVNKTDTCWLWTGGLEKLGYAKFKINNKKHLSHRVSFLMSGGVIPEGHVIRHKCRNRHCVNPEHLETGTHAENQADRIRDGTDNRGSKCVTAKLTESEVLQIRARASESIASLAREFQVGWTSIKRIIDRESWKHL